ncbi:hypothetical protein ABID23_000253 [Bartonella silvatica]|uniref:Uncharacterized protein n=1 Tax=Bartonella silvatica TaxID=357760 RepID=A0ABV2HF56_9HYPH
MKKIIILVAIVSVLGVQSTALRADIFSNLGVSDDREQSLSNIWNDYNVQQKRLKAFEDFERKQKIGEESARRVRREIDVKKVCQERHEDVLAQLGCDETLRRKKYAIDIAKYHMRIMQSSIENIQKIYQSLTGPRELGPTRASMSSDYLPNPQLIYNSNMFRGTDFTKDTTYSNFLYDSDVGDFTVGDLVLEEDVKYFSIPEIRRLVEERSQYASIADKAVSLQIFEQTENRFKYVESLLTDLPTLSDIKRVSELQAHLNGVVAVIKNEATKLQMVAHMRNAEQALISLQKYKRNVQILNPKNIETPTVRYRPPL